MKYKRSIIENRISAEIKRVREEFGITQMKLAEKADLSYTTVNEIENGNRSANVRTLNIIADALDCDLIIEFRKRDHKE